MLEGVSYSLRDCLEILRGMKVNPNEMFACGGGATSPLWRQMLCDLFGCPVKTGVCAGVYESVEEGCRQAIRLGQEQAPIAENTDAYEPFYQLYRSLYPSLKGAYGALARL